MSRIEDLEGRLAEDPQSKIFAQLAEEYRRAGLLDDAIETCRKGLQNHPKYFSARVALGRALLDSGSFEDAATELETVLAGVPDNILANKFLAEAYHKLGRLRESLGKYQVARALAPEDGDITARMSQVEAEQGAQASPPPPPPPSPIRAEPAPVATLPQFATEGEQVLELDGGFEEMPPLPPPLPKAEASAKVERPPSPPSFGSEPTSRVPPGPPVPPPADGPSSSQDEVASASRAELYRSQGQLEQALNVYRDLQSSRPNDPKVLQRIEELEMLARATKDVSVPERSERTSVEGSDRRGVEETIRLLEEWLAAIQEP